MFTAVLGLVVVGLMVVLMILVGRPRGRACGVFQAPPEGSAKDQAANIKSKQIAATKAKAEAAHAARAFDAAKQRRRDHEVRRVPCTWLFVDSQQRSRGSTLSASHG